VSQRVSVESVELGQDQRGRGGLGEPPGGYGDGL